MSGVDSWVRDSEVGVVVRILTRNRNGSRRTSNHTGWTSPKSVCHVSWGWLRDRNLYNSTDDYIPLSSVYFYCYYENIINKKNNEKIKSNSVFLFGPGVPQGFVLGLFFFCIYTFTGSSCDKTLFMTASTFKCVSSWYIYTLFTGCDETTNSTVKGSAVTLLHVIVNVLPCIHIKVLFHNKLELKMLNLNHCHFCIYYLKLKNVMVLTAESSNSIFIFRIMNYAYVTMSNQSKLHFFSLKCFHHFAQISIH